MILFIDAELDRANLKHWRRSELGQVRKVRIIISNSIQHHGTRDHAEMILSEQTVAPLKTHGVDKDKDYGKRTIKRMRSYRKRCPGTARALCDRQLGTIWACT
jgi:hypothetical protein